MRTHQQIIDEGGGPAAVAELVSTPAAIVKAGTVKQWRRTDSIPGPYWHALSVANVATLDELAAAASIKREVRVQDRVDTSEAA